MTETSRLWCHNAVNRGGSFIKMFAQAILHADDENFALLRPVLETLMKKYPYYLEGGTKQTPEGNP
jgi:hypothetical protein